MSEQQTDEHHWENQADDLDADAVCQECELVNPPGTLICKQCGNNLRDQRSRRLAALATGDITDHTVPGRRLLSGLLSMFGILAILWVGINFNNIVEWMTAAQTAGMTGRGDMLWRGNQGAMAEDLLRQLAANPPTQAEIDAATTTTLAENTPYGGRYVIVRQDPNGIHVLGAASVRQEGTNLYYCAILNNGDQIRGVGSVETPARATSALGVLDSRGRRSPGVGFAQRNDQGAFTIIAAGDDSDNQIRALAFRIPD